jgi:hypothetical protein
MRPVDRAKDGQEQEGAMASALTLDAQWAIPVGTEVYDRERVKIGKVVDAEPAHLLIDVGGIFFQHDLPIPMRLVQGFQDGKLYLNVTKEEALATGRDDPPGGLGAETLPA